MLFGEKEASNTLIKKSSESLNKSAQFAKNSHSPGNSPKDDFGELILSENSAESEPFYLVATTFSEALKMKEGEPERVQVPGGNVQNDYPVYKIYDSLNIEIFKHNP
jgi:hypothetical protein